MSTPVRPRHRARAALVAGVAVLALVGPLASASGAQPRSTTAVEAGSPICPASTANGRWVRYVFLQILARCPSARSTKAWTGRLANGWTRNDVAKAIDNTDENLIKNNVVPLYQGIINRAPTAGETALWVAFIRANRQDAELTAFLASTDRFYGQFASAPDPRVAFLTAAYNGILDRDPDPAGLAHNLAILGSSPTVAKRLKVLQGLEYSPENASGWVQAVYFAGLNRPGDPAGIRFWISWLQGPGKWHTFSMWTQFLSSAEAYKLAQTQPNPPSETAQADQHAQVTRSLHLR